jgi:transposase-like protein
MRQSFGFFSASCPYCKSIDFRSVGTRNGFEKAFRWLFQPYRCALCGRHFCLVRRAIPVGDSG